MKKPKPIQILHVSRLVLFSLLILALFIARGDSGEVFRLTHKKEVLGYASNITIEDLLKTMNSSRTAEGAKPLSLNDQLNSSAQLKANDMAAKNYWSHIDPSGTQPWRWFKQVGYDYSSAGENLAYGFSDSDDINAAWMNSATHKANILGDYDDVGFGIANSSNYQGGASTIVVAHYGKLRSANTATSTPVSQSGSLSAATLAGEQTNAPSAFELIWQGHTPTFILISIGLVSGAAAGFALAHHAFMRQALREGRRFFARHPLFDVVVVSLSISIILTTTVGYLI